MDIGTLTGSIAIEDQLSTGLEVAMHSVSKFTGGFEGAFGALGMTAGVAVAGIAATTAAITALGVKGSDVNDLANTMDSFTGSVEKSASIMEAMRQGTLETVGDMELMHASSKLLSTGTLQNAEDFKALSGAAFVLQNRGFGDTTEQMNLLSQALVTGRTKALQAEVGFIDLKAGQAEYASSINKTVDQLSASEKKHADQITILTKYKSIVSEAGEQERDFGEEIERAVAKFGNFMDDLSGAVARSPALLEAFKGLGKAFSALFGSDTKSMIDSIVWGFEQFIRGVLMLGEGLIALGEISTAVWYAMKASILLLETEVVGLGAVFMDTFDKIASVGAKLHIISPEAAASIHDARIKLDAMTESLKNDTIEAARGALGHSALGEKLAAARNALEDTQQSMGKLAGTTSEATVKAIEHKNVITESTKEQEKHAKAVQDQIDAWTGNSDKVKVVIDAYNQLTPAQLDNYDVQQALLPEIQRLVDAHIQISDAMKATYDASLKQRDGVLESERAILRASGVTQEFIEDQQDLGRSDAEIATSLGVSTQAFKLYQGEVKNADKVMEDARQTWIKFYDFTDGLAKKQMDEFYKSNQDRAKTVNDALVNAFTISKTYSDKYSDALLTGNAKLMNNIDEQQRAALAELGDAPAGMEAQWKLSRDNIITYFDDLRKVSVKYTGDVLRDTEMRGIKTADQLKQDAATESQVLQDMLAVNLEHEGTFTQAVIEEQRKRVGAANEAAKGIVDTYGAALSNLAEMFRNVGQAMGGSLGKSFGQIGGLVNYLDAAHKATKQIGIDGQELGGNFGQLSTIFNDNATSAQKMSAGVAAASQVMAGVSSFRTAMDQRGRGARAAGGAMAGAQIGSVAGPWGTAIGAGVGALVGLFKGDPEWAKAQDYVAQGFGAKISEETGKAIQATEKEMKVGTVAASLMHMSDIVKEAGGVTDQNLASMTTRLHDVFSMVETHQLKVSDGTKILDDNWAEFAKAGTDSYGMLDSKLVEIIKLNDQFGTQSQAILDYLGSQGAAGAQAFGTAMTITSDAMAQQKQDTTDLAALYAQLGNAAPNDVKKIQDQIDAVNADLAVQNGIIAATAITTQASADAVAAGIMADFGAMIDAGMSFGEALKNVTPAIQGLQDQMTAAGLSGSAVFQTLQNEVALYSDAIAGPALQSVDALSQGMVNLSNMGVLNQDTFAALSGQIDSTFNSLIDQGYDSTTVMLGMKDSLQRMWEEQQEFGYKTDDSTQALIDQAEAEGIVGEKHKDTNKQMLDATNKMVEVLEKVATALGADIPNQAAAGAAAVQNQLNKIKAPDLTVKVSYSDPGFTPNSNVSHASTGGVVTSTGVRYLAGGGEVVPFKPQGTDTVPAMLTPGERVLSVQQNQEYEANFNASNDDVVAAVGDLQDEIRSLPDKLAIATRDALLKSGRRVA